MQFAKYGTYEYFIARTAYIDSVVRLALEDNLPQIVFLGAGYDSRPYRFRDMIRETRLVELDSALTQQRKRSCLERAGVTAPAQLTYAPIEFTKENLAGVLRTAGFEESKKTLFVWQGVTYYLPAEAIGRTLEFVRRHAPDMLERYRVKESLAAMRAVYQNEPAQFQIQESAIESFLQERGFSLAEHLRTQDMEQRFLTLRDGSLAGRVLACFRLVQAAVSGTNPQGGASN